MSDEQVSAQARHWVVRLSDDTSLHARTQFDRWLEEHPSHRGAYHKAAQVWNAVGSLRHLAPLAAIEPAPIRAPRLRRWAVPLGLAATLLIAVTASLAVFKTPTGRHQTATAEIRDVALPDGSTATLGARSVVDTHFTAVERRILLKEGEALFSVAADPARPFVVVANNIAVRALGTEFEVHRGVNQVRIAVLSGSVEVAQAQDRVRLIAGQELNVTPDITLRSLAVGAASEPAAWRTGTLRFADASLSEVIADANRYYDGQISLGDPKLSDLRLTTSFGTRQVGQLLDSLPGVLPVRLDRTTPGHVIIFPKGG